MADKIENANELYWTVANALDEHPDWLPAALSAVTSGMERALVAERRLRANKDAAMLAALALCVPSRVTADARDELARVVIRGMDPTNRSVVEERFAAEHQPNPADGDQSETPSPDDR